MGSFLLLFVLSVNLTGGQFLQIAPLKFHKKKHLTFLLKSSVCFQTGFPQMTLHASGPKHHSDSHVLLAQVELFISPLTYPLSALSALCQAKCTLSKGEEVSREV